MANTRSLDSISKNIFKGCVTHKKSIIISKKQKALIEKDKTVKQNDILADKEKIKLESSLIYTIKAKCKNENYTAYVDSHVIRTDRETLLIVIDSKNQIHRIELINFFEPKQYKVPNKWLQLFVNKKITEKSNLSLEIPIMAGATLTSRATTRAVKRVLTIHKVLTKK